MKNESTIIYIYKIIGEPHGQDTQMDLQFPIKHGTDIL